MCSWGGGEWICLYSNARSNQAQSAFSYYLNLLFRSTNLQKSIRYSTCICTYIRHTPWVKSSSPRYYTISVDSSSCNLFFLVSFSLLFFLYLYCITWHPILPCTDIQIKRAWGRKRENYKNCPTKKWWNPGLLDSPSGISCSDHALLYNRTLKGVTTYNLQLQF